MTNDENAKAFLAWVGNNYERIKKKYMKFCSVKHYEWDEDIFASTYLKVHDKILKNGIDDNTEQGFENYFFLSFRNNVKREGQYARNAKRDSNVTSNDLNELYEIWFNKSYDSSKTKLLSDLYKDFAALYILLNVEQHFGSEYLTLFREKYFNSKTYKEIKQRYPNVSKTRDKIIETKAWVIENIKKDDINKLFEELYNEFF